MLSIVIPTVSYSPFLDLAIESCLKHKELCKEVVVCINGVSEDGYKKSKYFSNEVIKWKCNNSEVVAMFQSFNYALSQAKYDWVFILSDDDLITSGFLKGIDLSKFQNDVLFATNESIIDEKGQIKKVFSDSLEDVNISSEDGLTLFFEGKLHHHISLFVFNKWLFFKTGGFVSGGYENGYYIDTIFHGKLIANCNQIKFSSEKSFLRRESSFQASSKFYLGKEVDLYFNLITNALFDDEKFRLFAIKKNYNKYSFKRKLLRERFYIEWTKINNPVFNKSQRLVYSFVFKYICYWKTGAFFKLYTLFFLIYSIAKKQLGAKKNI